MNLSIDPELKRALPSFFLGCVCATVRVEKHNASLWDEISAHLAHLTATIKPEQIATLPQIAATRSAYKALGKDPSRYRGSAEALLRRVLSGKGLYQINSVVDINNLVSLESLNPAGTYDLEKITPPIELCIGAAGESFKGIGKDLINIEACQSLPILRGLSGPFGSPTSDSERAMVSLETKKILMVVFSFAGPEGFERWMVRAGELLRRYCGGDAIESALIT